MNPSKFDQQARCRESGGDAWFPEPGIGKGYLVEWAKAICHTCPLREACADWGIKHELHGIWGGLTHTDRVNIRRERGISIQTVTVEQFLGIRDINAA